MSSIQVAVRVRSFLPKIDGEDQCCVTMSDTETVLTNVLNGSQERKFAFDYSFWSFDGFTPRDDGYLAPTSASSKYKDQQYVFDKIGIQVLNNAWEGYNTCLFAYGQTGSGKSHSMIGYGANKGIVPLACEEIFKRITATNDKNITFEV